MYEIYYSKMPLRKNRTMQQNLEYSVFESRYRVDDKPSEGLQLTWMLTDRLL